MTFIRNWLRISMNRELLVFVVIVGLIAGGVSYVSSEKLDGNNDKVEQGELAQDAEVESIVERASERDGIARNDGESTGQIPYQDQAQSNYQFLGDGLAQWIMALFAIVATGVSVWAVRLLKATLEATREAVREAAAGTAAARDSVEVTRELGRAQLRAYLMVEEASAVVMADGVGTPQILRVYFSFFNKGETPANNINADVDVSVVRGGQIIFGPIKCEPAPKKTSFVQLTEAQGRGDLNFVSHDSWFESFSQPALEPGESVQNLSHFIVRVGLTFEDVFGGKNERDFWFDVVGMSPMYGECKSIADPGENYRIS